MAKGRNFYYRNITTTKSNQELLVEEEIENLYGYKNDVIINFELYNNGENAVTLEFNNCVNNSVVIVAKGGKFESGEFFEVFSCKVKEVGSTVEFLAILP